MVVFSVAVDAAGSPDPITLPTTVAGEKTLLMIPPAGLKYKFYDANGNGPVPMAMDVPLTLERPGIKGPYAASQKVCSLALYAGTGTFWFILV